MAEKVIILDQPKIGDRSQYNFVDGYSTTPPNYSESIGLPQNFDKFEEKDLHTTAIGSKINEVAIESNMKFSGSSYIRIDNIKIDNAGVNYKVNGIRIKGFIFSEEAFVRQSGGVTPIGANYTTLNNVLNGTNDKFCFYNKTFSRRGKKKGLGNIGDMEGVEIVSNFGVDTGTDIVVGDLPGNSNFNTGSGDGNTFELNANTVEIAEIINDVGDNPLYVAIWMRGNARRWFGTDKRRKRIQVYRINNLDLFANGSGKVTPITWENGTADNTRTGGGGGGGAEAAAFKITQFKMTINTLSGEPNTGIDQGLIDLYINDILPPLDFYPTDVNTDLFLQISPFQQLNNSNPPNQQMVTTFLDYFPLTTFGIIGDDSLLEDGFSDLQSYYSFQSQESIRASAPATITFNVNLTNPDNTTDSNFQDKAFIYFVIDWDDKNDEIKTIDDFLNTRPANVLELQELQRQGLYITDVSKIQHTYVTPGIKTVKFVTITYDEATNQLGRWKLVKARFYLDIPITEYPDFSEVGGSDYTTIPWPFTTAIIGGVDENSKYKTSIRNTLASGKIGSTDVIDEKFLINDRDNTELGQSINNMDLEQIRYFDTGSYNMNTLLGVNPITTDGFKSYNYVIDSPNEIEDPLFKFINHTNYAISNNWYGELVTNESRTGTDLYEQEEYDDNSKGIHIKYTATDITGNAWTFFRYQRKDLNNSLKTFEEGGTEYTFKFEIKFNEFTINAPKSYVLRAANRDNDYGTPLHNTDGFQRNETSFYRGDDGIYSNSDLTNKLADYGEWITIEKTRKLISDYASIRSNVLQEIDGYPNMEFLTSNWNETFESTNNTGFTDPQFLSTLPFPQYLEEFDINGEGDFDSFDITQWGNVSRPDIAVLLYYLGTGDLSIPNTEIDFFNYTYPAYVEQYVFNAQGVDFIQSELNNGNVIPRASDEGETPQPVEFYYNVEFFGEAILDFDIRNPIMMETEVYEQIPDKSILNQDKIYWDGETNKYSEETSVGQIFINDNSDLNLKQSCKLELNTGNLTNNSIYDSSGNSNKGLLIGDYKIKKTRKGEPMRRDSFIKVAKKSDKSRGAL
tara:strand:- start:836 stop:4066 length:3231 start_codon:yes stop_codon:yes gene_type:complete